MDHHHEPDTSDLWTQEYWDAKYADSDKLWSGRPNPRLVEHASDLSPGSALDVGSGEGADAIWLASRGWQVTGLDLSQVALDRAAGHAEDAGVTDRITWQQGDLLAGDPLPEGLDLVSAQFMHVAPVAFDELYRRLGAAVRPGGSLLVVGHHPDDLDTGLRHPEMPDLLFTPERVVAVLGEETWDVQFAGAPTREAADRDGRTVTVTDSVVHAVRR